MPPTFSLLAVSDRRAGERLGLAFAAWLDALAAAGLAGIAAVQLREKELDDRALLDLARLARATLPPAIPLLINGRLDVALAAGACIGGGVHLPADGVPAAALRRRFAAHPLLIGRSTHSLDEVIAARDEGVDYVTFGPVWETPGKGPPLGMAALSRAVAAGVPVYALGGVTLERLDELAAAGAAGAAAIRMFQRPAELARVARTAARAFARFV